MLLAFPSPLFCWLELPPHLSAPPSAHVTVLCLGRCWSWFQEGIQCLCHLLRTSLTPSASALTQPLPKPFMRFTSCLYAPGCQPMPPLSPLILCTAERPVFLTQWTLLWDHWWGASICSLCCTQQYCSVQLITSSSSASSDVAYVSLSAFFSLTNPVSEFESVSTETS